MFWPRVNSQGACARAQRMLADRSVGLLRAHEERWLAAHLAICAECAEEERVLRRVLALVDATPPVAPPPGMWQAVEMRIRAQEVRPSVEIRRRRLVPILATGAAVALTTGILLRGGDHTPPPLPPPDAFTFIQSHELLGRTEPFADRVGLVTFVTYTGQGAAGDSNR